MSVNKKQVTSNMNQKHKQELGEMWQNAESTPETIPDGVYQFKVKSCTFTLTGNSKPCFKQTLEILSGNDDLIGETLEIRDNLETKQNMTYFKQKLARLNINVSEVSMEDIIDGVLAEQLKGYVFEGKAVTKTGFLNIYVNRLISENGSEEENADSTKTSSGSEEEEEVKEEVAESKFSEGDLVTWKGKKGEVVEVLEDEGLVRVRKDDGTKEGSIVRVHIESLEKMEQEEEEAEELEEESEEEEETQSDSELQIPDPEEVEDLSMKDVRNFLGALEMEAEKLKNPRAVLRAFSALAQDKNAKIDLSEVSPLAQALGVTLKKTAKFKEQLKALATAVHERLA